MFLSQDENGFSLFYKGRLLFRHSAEEPMLYVGAGCESIVTHRGNFTIEDHITERIALGNYSFTQEVGSTCIRFSSNYADLAYCLDIRVKDDRLHLTGSCNHSRFNRLWLKMQAEESEHIYGLGEQFSALDLRGRSYPIFTSEQGVGRNKKTMTTFLADQFDGGGGDYWTTYFPQASFVSSRLYFFHLCDYDYTVIDLKSKDYHGIHIWNTSFSAFIDAEDSYPNLLEGLSGILGRQPMLPEWAFRGVWLGMQGGSEICRQKVQCMLGAGTDVSAVWTQDWVGRRDTSFGQRLQWDWRWNRDLYPTLEEDIREFHKRGIHWLGYINPYLVSGGQLFEEARKRGFFVCRKDGSDYLMDFGEFDAGIVDLTNPAAILWYRDVITGNMLKIGLRGWMADFGEYLPTDCVLYSGISPVKAHNQWPTLWAKLNREAVTAAGFEDEVAFFTRSGASHTGRYSPLMFGGDQCVDWSEDDGLPSVINAALSLAMSGFGVFTFDIGGYTALFHLRRTKELLLRGCEFAAFTPVMRTHEGNRPAVNHQFDQDEETIAFFSRFSRIHTSLSEYMISLAQENSQRGIPVMRPLFFHSPKDEKAAVAMNQYMLGYDVVVAPVVEEGAVTRRLYLPWGDWLHLWSAEEYPGEQDITVRAPLGQPPVFFRKGSRVCSLIHSLRGIK